ncbi:MAG: SDR family NAD(P)-dependent oxidoreductase [Okeania sp. SIO3B5]|nr:SDR family NAD(P)-dependent oxidoreductase [Okeania sp. SIO3B5]
MKSAVVLQRALVLDEEKLKTIQTVFTPLENQTYQFQIFSTDQEYNQQQPSWKLHIEGKLREQERDSEPTVANLEALKETFPQQIEVTDIYQKFHTRGIDYGVSFQCLKQLWCGEGKAMGEIQLPEELVGDLTNYQLHPVFLDVGMQVITAAIKEEESQTVYMPVSIERLTVYDHPDTNLWAMESVAKLFNNNTDSYSLSGKITLLNSKGETIAVMEGLQLKQVTREALMENEADKLSNWLYEIEWRSQPSFSRELPPEYLLSPVAIDLKLRPLVSELASEFDFKTNSQFVSQLEALSLDYIIQAFVEINWSFPDGESFSSESLAENLEVVSQHRQLFNRLLEILAEEGILQGTTEHWQVVKSLGTNPQVKIDALRNQYPQGKALLTLLERCGSQLSAVLRGKVDPLQLVFPEGDLTTTTQVYEELSEAQLMNTVVQQGISTALEKLPKDRGVRLLEIGAGTGGTSSYLLPRLNPLQTEYVFTDLGSFLINKAKEKFQDYPFVRYQQLDIEKDPTAQGFESHKYDLIVAANVLHATTSLQQTLENVRQLLAPEGILVLLETTSRQRYLDLVFGLLEGWWRFQDVDLRPNYPLLEASQWQQILKENNFPEVVVLPEIEGNHQEEFGQSVIIAQSSPTPSSLALPDEPKSWLILADRQRVGENLATQMRSRGEICTLVKPGQEYQQIEAEEFTINPENPEDFQKLISQLVTHSATLYGVIQCWSLETPEGNLTTEELTSASQIGCGTTLSLVQALVKTELSRCPHLWLVTQGAQAVPDNNPVVSGVAQSSLCGMGKTIASEHPELKCVRLDLDPQQEVQEQARTLMAEIYSESSEDEVAFRQGSRYVSRLVRSRHTQDTIHKPLTISEEATYLIAGGLGGVGLLVARWLVEKGARHLVLIGRSGVQETTQSQLSELEQAGAQVIVAQADVSDMESLSKVWSEIEQNLPPLKGVINSAGVVDDTILKHHSWQKFIKVMAPKIEGSWNLHVLSQNQSLDFFVMFSSITYFLGTGGAGNYSSANAFQHTLAYYRQSQSLPAMTINWGFILGIGLETRVRTIKKLQNQAMGLVFMSPEKAMEALELLLGTPTVGVGVVPMNWSQLFQTLPADVNIPFFEELAVSQPVTPVKQYQLSQELKVASTNAEFLAKLEAASNEKRQEILTEYIRRQVAQVLGFSSSKLLEVNLGFMEMGMDSLMTIELKNRLQNLLGTKLPETIAIEYPTIAKLSLYIEELMRWKTIEIDPSAEEEETETKLMMERSKTEAIAIIGIGCRFPGNANTPESFWELLSNGEDSITEIPLERWDIDFYYDPNPETPGKMYIRHAALIDKVDKFDPRFFGISDREAHRLDPQQRLILEVTWEALERASINPQQLENTQTGVFLGIGQNDYANLGFRQGAEDISPYDATGNGFCFVAGRLSYFLGLQGPSIAIDTACSSSLVAVHEACQSLRQGESNLALAGGVQLILSPEVTTALSKLKALAPDGKCKTFDAAADGYGRGEGCGIVVLKRLSDALKDGDRISAVIRGSAVNHDGPSSGMTVPNKLAQEKLIQKALKAAKVEPDQVSYVEAHGTGTSLGDPMEVRALARVFEEGREGENLLNIGSVKTNIGHLEAAAGIAGIIKVILQLQHQEIAPHLHFANPNPYIDWENMPLKVPTQLTPWLSSGDKRVAGVSSFGMSGTNVHVVLEEAPIEVRSQNSKGKSEDALERPLHLLTLSAKTEKALEDLVSNYQSYLETNPELALADVCYTANSGRAQFNYRLGAIASSPTELREKLLEWKTQSELVGVFSGQPNSESPKIAFLFTGQGSQYVNMGRQLYEQAPTFRQAIEAGKIGQIQIQGLTLTSGYYNDPEKQQEAFTEDGWFKTGDLGFLKEGRLTITGRQKDVIIINGINYYSHEIEGVVEELKGIEVSYTAACVVRQSEENTDRLAIFFSYKMMTELEKINLLKEIRSQVIKSIGVNPDYLIPVEPKIIPKTAIGKIQRSQLKQQFEAGGFNSILKEVDLLLENHNTIPNWFYQQVWREKEVEFVKFQPQTGISLILFDSLGLGSFLSEKLTKYHQSCIKVFAASEFTKISEDSYTIALDNPEHYQQLLESISVREKPISQILHLVQYQEYTGEITELELLEQAQVRGLYSLLYLIQALDKIQGTEHPVRLFSVANNSQLVQPTDKIAYEKTTVLGLLKTIVQEIPGLSCRHIDLPVNEADENKIYLWQELCTTCPDLEIAYRNGKRFISGLEAANLASESQREVPLQAGGVYLISGGLGGIGVQLAQYLLQQYQTRLILVGRTPL